MRCDGVSASSTLPFAFRWPFDICEAPKIENAIPLAETDPRNAGQSIRGRRLLRGGAWSLVAKNAHDKRSVAQLFVRVALSRSRPVGSAVERRPPRPHRKMLPLVSHDQELEKSVASGAGYSSASARISCLRIRGVCASAKRKISGITAQTLKYPQ